jgi:tRNA(adenine34) deaminase
LAEYETVVNEKIDRQLMAQAIDLAETARKLGEVPVGAIVVRDGEVLGCGYNQPIGSSDPTAHAEIVALRCAAQNCGNYRLPGSTLYVTIEPCMMCLGAMIHARISRLVFGALEPRAGVVASQLGVLEKTFFNHRMSWSGGVLAEQCSHLISGFFREKRDREKPVDRLQGQH